MSGASAVLLHCGHVSVVNNLLNNFTQHRVYICTESLSAILWYSSLLSNILLKTAHMKQRLVALKLQALSGVSDEWVITEIYIPTIHYPVLTQPHTSYKMAYGVHILLLEGLKILKLKLNSLIDHCSHSHLSDTSDWMRIAKRCHTWLDHLTVLYRMQRVNELQWKTLSSVNVCICLYVSWLLVVSNREL